MTFKKTMWGAKKVEKSQFLKKENSDHSPSNQIFHMVWHSDFQVLSGKISFWHCLSEGYLGY